MSVPRLTVRALKKSFGANAVLRGLDFELAPGEIHALIGGNGAGKSTLSKIVAGLLPRDAGEIELDGAPFAPTSRRAAQAAGVVMVLQELSVLPTLSVAENLFLHALPRRWGGLIDQPRLLRSARTALDRVGLATIDPKVSAATLGVGQQQLVEIAAGLAQECRLLILDEPTAALTGAEIETLFFLLRGLRARGTSILYISHRLDEIGILADRVSVLRDGQLVATLPAREASRDRLVALMAGETASVPATSVEPVGSISPLSVVAGLAEAGTGVSDPGYRSRQHRPHGYAPEPGRRGEVVLRIENLQAGTALRGVSLDLHAGEIVGLGGLVGAGRTELLRAIFGADRRGGGTLALGPGQTSYAPASTPEALAAGFAFVPEDRKQHGLFAPLSVSTNASIAHLPRRRGLPGWLDADAEAAGITELLGELQVRYADAGQPIAELSGGNQQKIVIGRWLRRDVRVWLLDEPTRGVDAAARRAIYALLRLRAAAGAALLVASSDYDELATLCDRVIVLSNGIVGGELTRAALTPEAFTAAAFAGFRSHELPRVDEPPLAHARGCN